MIKFLSMVEKPVVTKETKRAQKVVPDVTDPMQFRDLLAIKMQESQVKRQQLIADGFTSQVDVLQKKLEADCLEEISKMYNFKKIESDSQAFSNNPFGRMWDAYKSNDTDTLIAFRWMIPCFVLAIVMYTVGRLASVNSDLRAIPFIICGISALGTVISFICGIVCSYDATSQIIESSWEHTSAPLTDKHMAAIKLARNLNMFDSITVVSRPGDRIAVTAIRNGIIYKII